MNYIVKSILLLYVAVDMVAARSLDYGQLVMLLLIVAVTIVKEKFIDANSVTAAALLLIAGGLAVDWQFALLLGLPLYDFVLKRSPIGIAVTLLPLLPIMAAGTPERVAVCFVLTALCGLLAYTQRKSGAEQRRLTDTLDNERRLRYELEQTKMKLLRSSKEINRSAGEAWASGPHAARHFLFEALLKLEIPQHRAAGLRYNEQIACE